MARSLSVSQEIWRNKTMGIAEKLSKAKKTDWVSEGFSKAEVKN